MTDKADRISEELFELSIMIIKITAKLNNNQEYKVIKDQMLRSGTSAGANYEEARGAESRADFIHKLHIAYKELRETNYWLRLMNHTLSDPDNQKIKIAVEKSEILLKILGKSIVTSKRNRDNR